MFKWTSELEAFRLPARGQGEPVSAKPVADKKLFAVAVEARDAGIVPRESVAAWIERGSGDGAPADEADLFVIVGSRKAGNKLADGMIDRWFARFGARGAVEIFTHVGGWLPDPSFPVTMLLDPMLPRVRAHLAHAADYEAARDFLVTHPSRQALPAWSRSERYNASREVLALLLPDERELCADAVAHVVESDWTSTRLLAAVQTPAELAQLGNRIGHVSWDEHAVTLAGALRDEALPALVAYSQRTSMVVGVARALTAYVSETAASALALYLENKKAFPILDGYFKEHRELARTVLEPLTSAKKKQIRETAVRLLAGA
ncbi:MAG: hypothetical protein M4D80_09935 [Myxococcota bacterium]|nr:hypothetical protein [Deltaproteobacteria bacterium]MDQ3335473.1 hypothetical protein [Myxococcota bacterium]